MEKAGSASGSVFGVISSRPGAVLGWKMNASAMAGQAPVALLGRAPVVGIALEGLASGQGTVLCFVKPDQGGGGESSDIQELRRENRELKDEIRELRALVEKRK